MCLFVERIPNKPVDSNSFVIYCQENSSCIVVDPGTEDCFNLIEFLEEKNLNPKYLFLTHEHFDHIWGVNKLKDLYGVKILCSMDCASKIIDKKKNMSVFYNQVGFETYPADIVIEEINHRLIWRNYAIEFIHTEGHTNGSICFSIDGHLFTGDTLIKNEKTVTKLPGGSKTKLDKSFSKLKEEFLNKQIIVHAGHGVDFYFKEFITQNEIK